MKFRNLLLAAILSVLAGCATTGDNDNQIIYNPVQLEESGSYLRLFRAEAEKRNININYEGLRVYFVDKFHPRMEEMGVIGLCDFQSDKQIVYIRRPSWNSYDSMQREMLIFHEIGHCLLGQVHDQSMDFDSVPVDLMFPASFPSFYYAQQRTQFLDRMFKKVSESLSQPNALVPRRNLRKRFMCGWGKTYRSEVSEENRRRNGP